MINLLFCDIVCWTQQVQYIDLSEIVLVVKTVVIVTGVHFNLLMLFVASHF